MPIALGIGMVGAIVSAMSGGGGGLFFLPVMLMVGVPPHFAVAASKANDVGINIGALGMIGTIGRVIRRLLRGGTSGESIRTPSPRSWIQANLMIIGMIIVTFLNVLVAAWLIPMLAHVEWTNMVIAYVLIIMAAMTRRSKAFQEGVRSAFRRKLGYPLYWIVSLAQAVFGMGIGMFISMVLMYAFGFGTREANRLKRLATFYQSLLLIVVLALQGSMLLGLSAAALLGAIAGAKIGTRIVKGKSDATLRRLLGIIMVISGIGLLVG